MPSLNAEKLKKIQEFIDLTKSSLTHDEFLASFKEVIDHIKKCEEKLSAQIDQKTEVAEKELADLQSAFQAAVDKVNAEADKITLENQGTISNIKKWAMEKVSELFLKSSTNRILTEKITEIDSKLTQVNDKILEVSSFTLPDTSIQLQEASKLASKLALDELKPLIPSIEAIEADLPKLGLPIRDSLELLPPGEKLKIEAIENLREELDKLEDKIKEQRIGGVSIGARIQNTCSGWVTPTGTLDGSNKTFTVTGVPLSATAEVQINGQGYYDFTVSGSTYTLTDAPVSTDLLKVRHWL